MHEVLVNRVIKEHIDLVSRLRVFDDFAVTADITPGRV